MSFPRSIPWPNLRVEQGNGCLGILRRAVGNQTANPRQKLAGGTGAVISDSVHGFSLLSIMLSPRPVVLGHAAGFFHVDAPQRLATKLCRGGLAGIGDVAVAVKLRKHLNSIVVVRAPTGFIVIDELHLVGVMLPQIGHDELGAIEVIETGSGGASSSTSNNMQPLVANDAKRSTANRMLRIRKGLWGCNKLRFEDVTQL